MSDVYDKYPTIISTAKPPVVVVEVGVGRAEDTGRMVDWIIGQKQKYQYLAFEAEVNNIPEIAQKVGAKVTVINAAVGDADGFSDFISSGSWPLSGSVKQPVAHLKSYPWIPWQPPVKVPMIRLDTAAKIHALEKIDFLWMDVQGAEDLVIAGGQEILKRTRFAYTEVYETEEYAGQIGLAEILKRLPGRWKVVQQWAGDFAGNSNVLLSNTTFR